MGSSSVLVWTGSDSHCNSFVVNQFLFFTPNGENSFCYTPKKEWEQCSGKNLLLFFISKIYSHVTQKWWPKMGMAIPYCLYWKLLHTRWKYSDISNLFAKLQHHMQKHQKANFRTDEYVCIQQWWLKVSIMHVSWQVTSWNTHSLTTCTRSTMRTGENTAAINNKALLMPRSEHRSCRIIS